MELATFAGGCFWCMAAPFEKMDGVIHVVSGYTGGYTENPTYKEVCSGSTGHYEAVQITFEQLTKPPNIPKDIHHNGERTLAPGFIISSKPIQEYVK